MSNYFILDEKVDESELWVADYDAIEFLDFQSREGSALEAEGPVATLIVDDDSKSHSHLLSGIQPFPVVSETFRQVVLDLDKDRVQFFPVVVSYCDEPIESEPFWFLNVLENVACLDTKKSDLEISALSGIPTEVYELVLREDKLSGRHLVRMDEFPTILLVSQELRERLERAGLPSRHFMNIEDYSDEDY